jgi:hypothetical protein
MQKLATLTLVVSSLLALNACQNPDSNKTATPQAAAPAPAPSAVATGDYCFLKAANRDSTIVRIRILSADDIRGEMIWNPYQKDGAVGALTGKMTANGEMELLYDYMIEGSRQTEAKVMKMDNQKLLIKVGELVDPKNDGNLKLKDASKAEYKEVLEPTKCD